MNKKLQRIGRNINQIVKRVNSAISIYKADIEELREELRDIWQFTENHHINSTLKKAIEYICNPEKTDGALLIGSYGYTPETAYMEFEWTRKQSNENPAHLARNLIQSFVPGETTPEQSHEIGKQFVDEVLGIK